MYLVASVLYFLAMQCAFRIMCQHSLGPEDMLTEIHIFPRHEQETVPDLVYNMAG